MNNERIETLIEEVICSTGKWPIHSILIFRWERHC